MADCKSSLLSSTEAEKDFRSKSIPSFSEYSIICSAFNLRSLKTTCWSSVAGETTPIEAEGMLASLKYWTNVGATSTSNNVSKQGCLNTCVNPVPLKGCRGDNRVVKANESLVAAFGRTVSTKNSILRPISSMVTKKNQQVVRVGVNPPFYRHEILCKLFNNKFCVQIELVVKFVVLFVNDL